MDLLIRNGRVIDPSRGFEAIADVLIVNGQIAAIDRGLAQSGRDVLDASGLTVAPGLIDMHVHLRDPGQTHKEDISSGAAAAVHGGFTAVACMPNTSPPIDTPVVVEYILGGARGAACRVHPIAAITKGLRGNELTPIGGLVAAGAVALSDDGATVLDAGVLRRAMMYTAMVGVPVIEHCEDVALSDGGAMHDGATAALLGLRGIPAVSESVVVARDLLLAEATGARVHIAHVSAAASVQAIREAKRRGVRVTAEVTPHHLVLTERDVGDYDTNRKMNPPLRGAGDMEALRQGLADGTLDVIATDHAPHAPEEKLVEFDRAPFGVIGLETALGVVLTHLVRPGILTMAGALEALSAKPAEILGVPGGRLEVGVPADLVIIDPDRRWTVRADDFASRSRNTPFEGWNLVGKAVLTIVGGEIRYDELGAKVPA